MPLDLVNLRFLDRPVTKKEGLQILERDEYRCQYCGLDGRASFENALAMSVDFVVPRARKGKKDPHNLVACCRSCNMIKGKHVYRSFDEAKAFVLKRRTELRKAWERTAAQPVAKAPKVPEARTPAAEPAKAKAAAAAASVVSSSPLSLRQG
jgi:HNH endonuclease